MSGYVLFNIVCTALIGSVLVRCCPWASWMNGIPGRVLIFACSRAVAMLAEAVVNFHLVVPDGLEPVDKQILRSLDPGTAHDKITAVEISDVQVVALMILRSWSFGGYAASVVAFSGEGLYNTIFRGKHAT
jgi:hypothetical protein